MNINNINSTRKVHNQFNWLDALMIFISFLIILLGAIILFHQF